MNALRKLGIGALLVGSTVTAGAFGTTLVGSANAATTSTTAPSATAPAAPSGSAPSGTGTAPSGSAPSGTAPSFDPSKGGHTANGKTETLLTGDDATKATAAALAAVPGATVQRVETDADGGVYEAHVVTSDGTMKTVQLDANFKVTSVDAGPSAGSNGKPGAAPSGSAPGSSSTTSSTASA